MWDVVEDHPRSRGVYTSAAGRVDGTGGSSPLARGLRRGRARTEGDLRIIPARAGFTPASARPAPMTADHPRSRGVYGAWVGQFVRRIGSSPLARGLPGARGVRHAGAGIIPARAGFTRSRASSESSHRDHPRSRGVYNRPESGFPSSPGSSPLARGLRPPCTARRRCCPDHPRSRGVYEMSRVIYEPTRGSSPLARGLPSLVSPDRDTLRIIPARAGFTTSSRCARAGAGDHPRSRGVYAMSAVQRGGVGGSSPLARGLPEGYARVHRQGGIIPARAGFTPGDD